MTAITVQNVKFCRNCYFLLQRAFHISKWVSAEIVHLSLKEYWFTFQGILSLTVFLAHPALAETSVVSTDLSNGERTLNPSSGGLFLTSYKLKKEMNIVLALWTSNCLVLCLFFPVELSGPLKAVFPKLYFVCNMLPGEMLKPWRRGWVPGMLGRRAHPGELNSTSWHDQWALLIWALAQAALANIEGKNTLKNGVE